MMYDLEMLADEAGEFKEARPGRDYLLRTEAIRDIFPRNMLGVYGSDAASQAERWQNDIQQHFERGLHLAAFDTITLRGERLPSHLSLYAPAQTMEQYVYKDRTISTVEYHTKVKRGRDARTPAWIALTQTLRTSFCEFVPLVPHTHIKAHATYDTHDDHDPTTERMIINRAQLFPLNRSGMPIARGPKHEMHVTQLSAQEIRPSGDEPVVNVSRPRNLDSVSPIFARSIHALIQLLAHDLTEDTDKAMAHQERNTPDALLRSTSQHILGFSSVSYEHLAGNTTKTPSVATLEDMVGAVRQAASWLATSRILVY